MSPLREFQSVASGLAHHPQDHGWRDLHRLFDYGLQQPGTNLEHVLATAYQARPVSAAHLLTLLGIALKVEASEQFPVLTASGPAAERFPELEKVLRDRGAEIRRLLACRQNSFTCARRFLVPQVILSAYFGQHSDTPVRFADLGTGLGVLPHQLHSRTQFETFGPDLSWPGGVPMFQPLRFAATFAVDKAPMPDMSWVLSCYGDSSYYAQLHDELDVALRDPTVASAPVRYAELDLLDAAGLTSFIRENQVNAANLSYVLYEFQPQLRRLIIDRLTDTLAMPALLIVTEPAQELGQSGCQVNLYTAPGQPPFAFCRVSDGHFIGHVSPLRDYDSFVQKYPIPYQPRTGGQ
jgi:hypothetical protein